jgi:hypothetical protein
VDHIGLIRQEYTRHWDRGPLTFDTRSLAEAIQPVGPLLVRQDRDTGRAGQMHWQGLAVRAGPFDAVRLVRCDQCSALSGQGSIPPRDDAACAW